MQNDAEEKHRAYCAEVGLEPSGLVAEEDQSICSSLQKAETISEDHADASSAASAPIASAP